MKYQLTISVASLLLAFAGATHGQIPIPYEPGRCGGVHLVRTEPKPTQFQPKSLALAPIKDNGFCSQYTFEAGWKQPLEILMGEGAWGYYSEIYQAVTVWREAIWGAKYPFVGPPILLSFEAPRNFSVPEGVWQAGEPHTRVNVQDGQSVIYFKSSGSIDTGSQGFARVRAVGSEMVEADIYINIRDEVQYGPNISRPRLILDVDEQHGVYSFLNSTYITILHEIGHALGLEYISINGNAMSYQYTEQPTHQWEAPMSVFLLNQLAIKGESAITDPTQIQFVFRKEDVHPYMAITNEKMLESMEFFTGAAGLGEQDRTALMCVYGVD